MVSFAGSPFEDKRIHLRVRPLPGWCVRLSDDKPWGGTSTLAPLHLWSKNKRRAGQKEENPDPMISITGRWKIIWYLSLLKAPIPSAPKILPAKLNKRGERSFDAYGGRGVERKWAQQVGSWWQWTQKKEVLKILSKKRNLHCAILLLEHLSPFPVLCLWHQN